MCLTDTPLTPHPPAPPSSPLDVVGIDCPWIVFCLVQRCSSCCRALPISSLIILTSIQAVAETAWVALFFFFLTQTQLSDVQPVTPTSNSPQNDFLIRLLIFVAAEPLDWTVRSFSCHQVCSGLLYQVSNLHLLVIWCNCMHARSVEAFKCLFKLFSQMSGWPSYYLRQRHSESFHSAWTVFRPDRTDWIIHWKHHKQSDC